MIQFVEKNLQTVDLYPSEHLLEPLGKDMRALWTKNSEVEKQSISEQQVSLCGCFSMRAAWLSTVKSAFLSTAILIPALTLLSSYLVQMERSRRSNSLFCRDSVFSQ